MHLPRLDWRQLVADAAKWETNIQRRAAGSCDVARIIEKYQEYRKIDLKRQELGRVRNKLADNHHGHSDEGLLLRKHLSSLEQQLEHVASEVKLLTTNLPNSTHLDVPDQDTCISEFNTDAPEPATLHDHIEALAMNGWMDSEEGTRIAGRGFSVLRGSGALLEHALVNYALKFAVKNGFTPVTVPDMIREDMVEAAGFAPRISPGATDPVFRCGDGLALAGTAELPMLAMHKDTTHHADKLPKLYVAVGRAFRREAGQTGAAVRGLYRQHQFTKVEFFALSTPQSSDRLYEWLCSTQLELIASLGFKGRRLEMSAKELGASAFRKRDIELWLPFSKRYGEVTSASHCTDYQARRCNIRYVEKGGGGFAHTMNATAIAVPRIIQCIAEHGMQIPNVVESELALYKF